MAIPKQVLILGGGFGGLTSANLIRKNLPQEECQITVVDKNQRFMMGLVNLWILSGSRRFEDSQVALNKLEAKGIKFLNDEITGIDPSKNSITTKTTQNESVALKIMMKVVLIYMTLSKSHDYGKKYSL